MYCHSVVLILACIVSAINYAGSQCLNNRFPTEGEWSDTPSHWTPKGCTPPHWTPKGCKVKTFNKDEAIQCLKGRTVYVFGSSIAREYGFDLAHLLGAEE